MPTLLDLSNADDPGTTHGRSMAGILAGDRHEQHAFAVSTPYLGSATGAATVVKDHWTAILYPRKERQAKAIDKGVDGLEKVERAGWLPSEDLLFDVDKDPGQIHNIIEQHPDVVEELRSDLLRRLEEVGTAGEIIERWR